MNIKEFLIPFLLLISMTTGCQLIAQPAKTPTSTPETPRASLDGIPALASIQFNPGGTISRHAGAVLDVQEIHHHPLHVLSLGTDGAVIGWDLSSGTGRLLTKTPETPLVGTFAEKAALVAIASSSGITISCIQGCSNSWRLTKIKARVSSLAFHQNDEALLIGGTDGRVYRWRYLAEAKATSREEQEKALERYIGHQTVVSTVTGLPVGRAFFSTDWDGTLFGWLPYSADDFGGKYDKNLYNSDFFGGIANVLRANRTPDRGIAAIAISPDSSRIVLGTEDGNIEVWDVRGFLLTAKFKAHEGRVVSVSTNRDASTIASVGRDSHLKVMHIQEDPLHMISATATSHAITLSSSQRIDEIKSVLLLSQSNAIITTASGALGEVKIDDTQKAGPAISSPDSSTPPQAKAKGIERLETDSDY